MQFRAVTLSTHDLLSLAFFPIELVFYKNISFLYFLSLVLCSHGPPLVFCNCAPSCEPSQHVGLSPDNMGEVSIWSQSVDGIIVIYNNSFEEPWWKWGRKQGCLLHRFVDDELSRSGSMVTSCSGLPFFSPFSLGLWTCIWLLTENLIVARDPGIWKTIPCCYKGCSFSLPPDFPLGTYLTKALHFYFYSIDGK